jgi:hypothetical protein
VKKFYDNDSELISLGTERPISHRVAVYLEPLFKERHVDCEYNRYRDDIKELEGIEGCDEEHKTKRIYPDIVIHERESGDRNNVAVIEIKPRPEMGNCDRIKLELMTRRGKKDKYKYEFGLFLGFEHNGCEWVLFIDGKENTKGRIEASS